MSITPFTARRAPLETIRLGFMPLLDAAVPVIAARRGFAAREGIEIELSRETSWANVRDRLAIGHFDTAHALAPMPVAAALGLTPQDIPLIAPMVLGTGGNAITVSKSLKSEMEALGLPIQPNDPKVMGSALRAAIFARKAAGGALPVFGVVHPYSSHNYELRYWLAASGIDPDRDVAITILSPPYMPDALATGRIDGFCVGEPWNTRAALAGYGHVILTKQAIWSNSPEKVLALREDWAARNPLLVQGLLRAMIAAARWCADPANRDDLVAIMSDADVLGTTPDELFPALDGNMRMADGVGRGVPGMLTFAGGDTNMPWKSAALWYHAQMLRWRHVEPRSGDAARVAAAFRPDLYRAAAASLGLEAPASDFRREGTGGSRFFDGETFDSATYFTTA